MWSLRLCYIESQLEVTPITLVHCEVLVKPMNLPVMEAIMRGGRVTNKELWIRRKPSQTLVLCPEVNCKMPAGTGIWCSRKYGFGDYTVAHVSSFRRTVCEQGWPKEQFVLSKLSETAPWTRKISNEEKGMEMWQVATNCTDNVFD